MTQYQRRIGVGAIIENDSKILLGIRNVDDNRGMWELLGGLRKAGESLEATVIREVIEESGLGVEPIEVVANYEREFPERNLKNIGLCFRCRYISGEPHQTEFGRVASFRWVSLEEAFTMELTPYTRIQLEQYQSWLNSEH